MRKGAVAAFAALALSVAAVSPWLFERFAPTASAVAAEPPPPSAGPGVPVTAGGGAVAGAAVFLNAIGAVQAFNMVTIKSRVDGQIMQVAFTEGQNVKAGAPLLQIDPRPFQGALEQAQAAKQKDEAQLVSAQSDLTRSGALVG